MADNTPIGFDGFIAYRTNVDVAIGEADRLAASAPAVTAAMRPAAAQAPPTHRDSGAFAGGLKKIAGWVIGIGLIIAVKACIFTGIHSVTSSPPASTFDSTPGTDTAPATTTSQWSNAQEVAPSSASTTTAGPVDDGSTLTKPEIGGGTLTIAELRYCEAEDIRIKAEKTAMDDLRISDMDKFNSHVDEFNASVEDSNSRCSNRSYAVSEKSLADSQVEAQRTQLEAEGRGRVD